MFAVLFLIYVLCTPVRSVSNRRLVDQLNNIGKTIGYINEDISTLFKNVENINKTIWSKDFDNPIGKYNERINWRKIDVMKPTGEDDNRVLTRQIGRVLKAFETEKRLNRKLQDQNQQLLNRIKATENMMTDFNIALADLETEFESERKRNQQCLTRLHSLEEKYSETAVGKKKFNDRLERLENNNLNIVKEIDSQVLTRMKDVEDNINDTLDRLEAIEENVSQMIENMTALIDQKDDTSNKATVISSVIGGIEREREIITKVSVLTSCKGVARSGIYDIVFSANGSVKSVYCDADTDGGDWVVTMRRQDGSEDFQRTWNDYKNGFGNVDGEFWIGNDILHELTRSNPMELRIDMEDFDGNKAFAKYDQFQVGSETNKYLLTVSGYSGTAGDSLSERLDSWVVHDGMKFTTIDSDLSDRYCAKKYKAGWWYNKCFNSLLTGPYSHESSINRWKGVIWFAWTGPTKSLKYVDMKLR